MKFSLFIMVLFGFIFLGCFTEWLWDIRIAEQQMYAKVEIQLAEELESTKMDLKFYNDWVNHDLYKMYINPIHTEDYDRLTSAYGHRLLHNPFTGGNENSEHTGIDLVGTWHSRVVAIADGIVIDNYYPPGNGWKGHPILGGAIRLQHQSFIPYIFYTGASLTHIPTGNNNGHMSVYGHLSVTYVNETDKRFVKQGQIIGRTGDTGMAYGEHLHFEIWDNGKTVNPLQYIDVTGK